MKLILRIEADISDCRAHFFMHADSCCEIAADTARCDHVYILNTADTRDKDRCPNASLQISACKLYILKSIYE